jgi:plasmid stabilization system protein ParE
LAQEEYEERRSGLGAQFASRVQSAVDRIAHFPEGAPIVYDPVRRVVIRRFPYSLFYVVEPSYVVVIGLHHQSEDPGTWPAGSQE